MDDGFNKAEWFRGRKKVTGMWRYNIPNNNFTIILDAKCPYTGDRVKFTTNDDDVGFNGWILRKES